MPGSEALDRSTLTALLESVDGDIDFLRELVETYLASTPELLDTMRQAVAVGDSAGLQRAAHSLKTGSANMGALPLAALCKQLEEMGRSGVLAGAEERIAAAAAAYDEAALALQDFTRVL